MNNNVIRNWGYVSYKNLITFGVKMVSTKTI